MKKKKKAHLIVIIVLQIVPHFKIAHQILQLNVSKSVVILQKQTIYFVKIKNLVKKVKDTDVEISN